MATNFRNFASPTPNLGLYGAAQRLTKAGLIESPYEAWTMPNEVQLKKSQPTVFDVHVNVPNTMFTIAYIQSQTNFRAAEIFPLIPVMKKSDYYVSYTKDYWFTNEAKVRLDGAETAGTGYGLDMTNTYICDVWGLHVDLGDMVAANADAPLNMQRDISLFLTQKLLLAREMQFVTNYFTEDVWTNEVDGGTNTEYVATTKDFVYWDDQVNSNPIEDVRKYRLEMAMATGFVPNTLVIGPEVYEALIVHPEILERIKYGGTPGSPAVISEQALAQVFSVDRVIIPMCVVNTAAEGASASPTMGFAYGKDALLCYSNPNPSILTPSAGYMFGWNGYLSSGGPYQDIVGSGGAGWFAVRNFRMEWRRAMRMEAEMAMGMELIAQDLGYFLDGCVSSSFE